MMAFLGEKWFDLLQTFGILSGFLLTYLTLRSDMRGRKVTNLLELTALHRDLWKFYLEQPEIKRIFERQVDPQELNATALERRFLNFWFLHMACYFEVHRSGEIVNLEGARQDMKNSLQYPIVSKFWEENKYLYNSDFVAFIDA